MSRKLAAAALAGLWMVAGAALTLWILSGPI